MKLRSRIFAVIAAAVAMGVVVTTPAMAETNQTLEIKNVVLGKCLAVGAPTMGRVTMEDCTGAKTQQWEQIRVDADKVILRNLSDQSCVKGLSGLARYDCDDEDTEQYWVFAGDQLKNAKTGQVADAYLYDAFGVILSDASGSDYQRWQVRVTGTVSNPPVDTSGKIVQLESVSENKCAAASGTAAALSACAGAVEQKFQRVELGAGVVQLRNIASGTCLRTGSFGITRVDLTKACASNDLAQQWRIEPDLIGTARVRNVASGNYLTPLGSSDGITTYERTSLANWQKWDLKVA